MRKLSKTTKEYRTYRKKYYDERAIGNTKHGVHVLTIGQYREYRKKFTQREILDKQTILHGKGEKTKLMKTYNKIKKEYKRGELVSTETTMTVGHGEVIEDIDTLGYHYNLSGLLKDNMALHFIISFRINEGEGREKVLADYGY